MTEITGSEAAKTDTQVRTTMNLVVSSDCYLLEQRVPSSEIEAPPSSFVTIDDPEVSTPSSKYRE